MIVEYFINLTNNLILFCMQDKIYDMESLTSKQKKVARLIQKDIAVMTFPFEETGNLCGLTGVEVLDTISELFKKGFIRKFGAILRHQRAGYKKNALVVWSAASRANTKSGRNIVHPFLLFLTATKGNPLSERNTIFLPCFIPMMKIFLH